MFRYKEQHDGFVDTQCLLQQKLTGEYFIHGMIDGCLYFQSEPIQDKDIENVDNLPEIDKSMYLVLIEPAIKDLSPHYELVNKRVQEKIRSLYSLEDELKVQRLRDTEPDEFESYNQWCESCRAWGREQKALMGFTVTE